MVPEKCFICMLYTISLLTKVGTRPLISSIWLSFVISIGVVLNISFPFFEQTVMLAFSSPLVFAQQDHLPLKKNMEYMKCLVLIIQDKEAKPLFLRREQLKDGYIISHKNKLTSAQKDSRICIFVVVMASTMLFYDSFRCVPFFKCVLCMDHVGCLFKLSIHSTVCK